MVVIERPPVFQVPAFIDVEASGLGPRSYPIRPPEEWARHDQQVWDEAAERVHGITRPILAAHGKPLLHVAQELNRVARGLTLYSDAWGNDYPWLAKLFDAADLPMHFQVESLRKLLDDSEAARWAEVKGHVIAELKLTRHRASSDARILQRTLVRIKAPQR
jgi:hypothetical protein